MILSSARSLRSLTFASATALALLASGCGVGTVDHTVAATPLTISGAAHGGEAPIVYSKVIFYETTPTGIAANVGSSSTTVSSAGATTAGIYSPSGAPTVLGSTYTDFDGNFRFTTPLTCSSSSNYVYAAAVGGNAGSFAGTLNPNLLLMAAVGSCSNLSASTFVIINELTTVAAAYALSGFTTTTGTYTTAQGSSLSATSPAASGSNTTFQYSGGGSLVSGQPVTLAGCTPTSSNGSYFTVSATASTVTLPGTLTGSTGCSLTPTTVTGTPYVSVTAPSTNYATSTVSGLTSAAGLAHGFTTANLLVPSNTGYANTTYTTNSGTLIPVSLINTLGNILQSCVNSVGGAAGSSTNCGTLFTNTTVTGASTAPSNTLAAAINIAHFPVQNVANIFALEPSTGAAFNPSLGTAPHDFAVGVAFTKFSGATNTATDKTTTGLFYPYSVALDGNDDVYVLNADASSTTQSNVVAFVSDGTPKWASAVDATTDKLPTMIAADTNGNVAFSNVGSTSTVEHVVFFTGAAGTPTTFNTAFNFTRSIAFDAASNLYAGFSSTTTGTDMKKYTYTAGTGYGTGVTIGTATGGFAYNLALDSTGNVWTAQYATGTAVSPAVVPYNTTTSTYAAQLAGTGSTTVSNYGIAVDASGNAWATGPATILKLVPTSAGGVITSVATTSAATYTPTGGTASLRFLSIDGNNNLWAVDNNSTNSALVSYNTTGSTPAVTILKPCITATATTCPAVSVNGIYGPRNAITDSAGNVWVSSSTDGQIVEVVGAGAPTWPVVAAQKPGLMP